MANKVWTGAVDTDFNVAGNWSASGVPADGDTCIFNDQAANNMTGSLSGAAQTGKTFNVLVEDGFNYSIGASGNSWTPGNGFGTVTIMGNAPAIWLAAGATAAARIVVDTASAALGAVNFTAGSLTNAVVKRGEFKISSGVTVTGRITVHGSQGGGGSEQSRCIIAAGCTLTGLEVAVKGGLLDFSTTIPTLMADGGEVIINGSAGVSTLLEISANCTVWWDAGSSTIAEAHVRGGVLKTRNNRIGRTLTSGFMYGDGDIDLSKGGLNTTITNGILVYGSKQPKFPAGAKITAAFA